MAKPRVMILALLALTGISTSTPGTDPLEPNALKGRIESLIAACTNKATVAVAFHNLATGEEFAIQGDLPLHPASTMKVPVMMEVFHQAKDGRFGLDDKVVLKNSFASIADGSPFSLDPKDDSELSLYQRIGGEATVRELVRLMITESSNLATNLLVDRVSAASTTELMRALGAEDVKVLRGVEDNKAYAKGLNNVTTARGLSRILSRLAERTVVSEAASSEMIDILKAQKFNEGIPAGLPPGTPVAHKTGYFQGVYHDAAIVMPTGRKPFVLVVLTRGIDDANVAHKLVADIAQAVHAHTSHP